MYMKMTLEQITNKWNQLEAEQRERVEAVENAMLAVLHDVERQQGTLDSERQRLEQQEQEVKDRITALKNKYRNKVISESGNPSPSWQADTNQIMAEIKAAESEYQGIGVKLEALDTFGTITPAHALVEAVKEAQEAAAAARPVFDDARAEIRQSLEQMVQEAERLNERILYSDCSGSLSLAERYNQIIAGCAQDSSAVSAPADGPRMGGMTRTVINDPDTYYQQKRDAENRMHQ